MTESVTEISAEDIERAQQQRVWVTRLGALIRERRKGLYTVEELAARAGVSAGLISQIERGIGNPSYSTLIRLSQALEMPVAIMFEGPHDEGQMLVRRAERRRLLVPVDGTQHEMLVPDTNRKLGLIRTVIPPGSPSDPVAFTHPGEEIVLVVSGKLHASIGGRTFVLEEGDTLAFDAGQAHSWSNPSKKDVEILLISTPPSSGADH